MTSLERYYSRHLRSLFISKFRYSDARTVQLIGGMRWVFLTKPPLLLATMLVCFFSTGRWPVHQRLRRSTRGGFYTLALAGLSVTYSHTFVRAGLQLLQKCKFFHFPIIDSYTFASDFLFEMVFASPKVLYSSWQLILPTFLELEEVFPEKPSLIHEFSTEVGFRCYFKAPQNRSLYSLQTAVRALQVPLVSSRRFRASLKNADCSFTRFGE